MDMFIPGKLYKTVIEVLAFHGDGVGDGGELFSLAPGTLVMFVEQVTCYAAKQKGADYKFLWNDRTVTACSSMVGRGADIETLFEGPL